MKGQDIVDRARIVLNDAAGTRWTDAELALWITDGCGFIGLARPDSCALTATMTLAAGAKQSIAGLTPAGVRLLDVVGNTGGNAITIVDRQVLDAHKPDWRAASAGATENYVFDNRDPRTFYVYPPASAGAQIEIVYSQVPQAVTAGTLGSATLTQPDVYLGPLLDYVLYRAYAKDSDETHNAELAAGYLQACTAVLGLKTTADIGQSPDLNSPGGKVSPGTSAGGV